MVAVPSIGRATQVIPRRGAPEADATRALYERYARQIHAYCLHQLGNREEAEDAVQSTFLNAFRGLKRGIDPEFESAWLYKIAENVCLTRQRSSTRRRRVESPGDLEAMQDILPSHQADRDELIRLPEALEEMPEQQRRALLLREWQGLSYREIADELELSQGAVETLLFRARRSLASALTDESKPKKAGAARKLRSGADVGSVLALLKTLLFSGGAKIAVSMAAVAATSVVATSPAVQHTLEDVVAPSRPQPAKPHAAATRPAARPAAVHSHSTAPSRASAQPVALVRHPGLAPTRKTTHTAGRTARMTSIRAAAASAAVALRVGHAPPAVAAGADLPAPVAAPVPSSAPAPSDPPAAAPAPSPAAAAPAAPPDAPAPAPAPPPAPAPAARPAAAAPASAPAAAPAPAPAATPAPAAAPAAKPAAAAAVAPAPAPTVAVVVSPPAAPAPPTAPAAPTAPTPPAAPTAPTAPTAPKGNLPAPAPTPPGIVHSDSKPGGLELPSAGAHSQPSAP